MFEGRAAPPRPRTAANVRFGELPLQHAVVDNRRLLTEPWTLYLQSGAGRKLYAEGTHADRVDPGPPPPHPPASYPPGALFWETDRGVLYQSRIIDGEAHWVYVSGTMAGPLAGKPDDLGLYDLGFQFYAVDYIRTWTWSPILAYTDLVIGAVNTQLTSAAHPFTAAQAGKVINITGGTGFTRGRYRVVSVAGATATVDRSAGTASSTAGKAILTDWQYAPGERLQGEIIWYPGAAPAGWTVCNGSVVVLTTPEAATVSVATPNLLGLFVKGGTFTGAPVAGTSGTLSGSTDVEASHYHGISVPLSGATAVINVQSGTGTSVPSPLHTHNLEGGGTFAGSPHAHGLSGVSITGASPAHMLLLPIVKL